MSIHEEAPGASDISLRDKAAPAFLITRGEDGALQWQPPARSLELANALSYHYPLEDTIEKKMQCAILDFLKSDIPEKLNKLTQDISQAQESPVQPLQSAHGTKLFGAWDVKTGKSVNTKGRKRGLSPVTRQRVAKNRGNTCAYHRKAKTQCHPNQCPQNKLYTGTTGNSIPKGTDQKLPNQKDKCTNNNSQISTDGSVTKPHHDSHFGKHSNALPSPSLSPPELNLPAEGDQTISCDPDHNYNGSGQEYIGNEFHDYLPSGAEPSNADGERPLLDGNQNQPRELGNLVESSTWVSNGNGANPLLNELDWSQFQSTPEHFPNGWQPDFNKVLPSDSGNGDTGHTGWTGDFTESDLPSLECDWPREDDDGLFPLSPSSPYPSISLDYGRFVGSQHGFVHSGPKDTLSIDFPRASPEALAAPSTQFYRGNLRVTYMLTDPKVSEEKTCRVPSNIPAPSLELDSNGLRNKTSESILLGKKERRKQPARELNVIQRAEGVKRAAPVPKGGQLISRREEPSVEELTALLQDSALKFLGTLEQLYPGKDESSSADIVLLDRTKQIPFAEIDLETIRNTFGWPLNESRLLHSSSVDISRDILPKQLSSDVLPHESEASILPGDELEGHTEAQSVQDYHLVFDMKLLNQNSPASTGRLLTLLYRSGATSTIFKRAIFAPSGPVAQSPPSTPYSLRWLDTEWRTVESILLDLDHTTNKYPRLHSRSRAPNTPPPRTSYRTLSLPESTDLSDVSEGWTSISSPVKRCSIRSGVEVASLYKADSRQPSLEAESAVAAQSQISRPTTTVSFNKDGQRMLRRKSSAAVPIINKPVDAVKDIWTRLARVKL